MKSFNTIESVREALKKARGQSIGLVPTMGYLHEGHTSLLKRATEENKTVVLSIFVNPIQFGPNEDFSNYPRSLERDLAIAEEYGADIVFMPSMEVMYPKPTLTYVKVNEVTDKLCGASRPGHFDGVATVVTKLFNIIQPDRAYFGLKDAQQVAVIQQMVFDLNQPVTIVPCPTVREEDGLAKSSRNVYLTKEEREQAVILSQSLQSAKGWIAEGCIEAVSLRARIIDKISSCPFAKIDYVEILSYPSLTKITKLDQPAIIALAVKFGNTRLIDNLLWDVQGGSEYVS